jgi:hypothetical protein
MTIKVSKPSINLREKLSELDFDKVPFQKMPAGSVLQVKEFGWDSALAVSIGSTSTSVNSTLAGGAILITASFTVQEGSKVVALFGSGQTNASGSSTNPYVGMYVGDTPFHKGSSTHSGTHHWFYNADSRAVITMQAMTTALAAGTHTFKIVGGSYNGITTFNYQTMQQGTLILMEVTQ